jgi:hypothetical protein
MGCSSINDENAFANTTDSDKPEEQITSWENIFKEIQGQGKKKAFSTGG